MFAKMNQCLRCQHYEHAAAYYCKIVHVVFQEKQVLSDQRHKSTQYGCETCISITLEQLTFTTMSTSIFTFSHLADALIQSDLQ